MANYPLVIPSRAGLEVHRGSRAASYAALSRRCAFVALWVFVLSMACSDEVVVGIGTTGKLCGLIAFAVGLFAVIRTGHYRKPTVAHGFMAAFVLLEASTYLWSIDPPSTMQRGITFIELLGGAWLLWEFADSQRRVTGLLKAFVVGCAVPSLYTIVNYLGGVESSFERYSGSSFDPNDLAVFLAIGIVWSTYLSTVSKGWIAWLYRAQVGIMAFSIMLTGSRTGMAAALVALLYVPLSSTRLWSRTTLVHIAGTAGLAAVLLIAVPSNSWDRMLSAVPAVTKGDLTERTIVWKAGWQQFESHTLFGVGAGAFGHAVTETLKLDYVAHNAFLSVLVEGGMITFLAFAILCATLLRTTLMMPPAQKRLWLATISVWLIGALTLTLEHRKPTWLIFALIVAQGAAVRRRALVRA